MSLIIRRNGRVEQVTAELAHVLDDRYAVDGAVLPEGGGGELGCEDEGCAEPPERSVEFSLLRGGIAEEGGEGVWRG